MAKAEAPDLDRFDRAILAILQADNTTPQRAIGDAVNLSAPAVQRRIKRMQQAATSRRKSGESKTRQDYLFIVCLRSH